MSVAVAAWAELLCKKALGDRDEIWLSAFYGVWLVAPGWNTICVCLRTNLSVINLNRIWQKKAWLGWTTEKFKIRKSRITLGTYWLFIGKHTPSASPICPSTLFDNGNQLQKSIKIQLKKQTNKQKTSVNQQDGSVDKVTCHQAWQLVWNPQTHMMGGDSVSLQVVIWPL